jgi:ligand-binding sensor domain-containing protein/signal transduction histidine kinase
LGTLNGLFRFDGVRFTAWDPPAGAALPSQDIRALCLARNGALWIGTSAGVSRWQQTRLVNFTVANHLPSGSVVALHEDRRGRIWASLSGGNSSALVAIQGDIVQRQSLSGAPPDSIVLAMYDDPNGQFWVGTNHGLCRSSVHAGFVCADRRSAVLSIAGDSRGNVLVADRAAHGVVRFAGGKQQAVIQYSGTMAIAPRVLEGDSDGNVWLGTLGQGLFRIQDGRVERYTRRDGLSSDLVEAVFEDRERNLWVGTANGLDRFRNPKAPRLTTIEGLSGDLVTAVCATRNRDVWVGTVGAGLNRVSAHGISTYTLSSGLPSSTVLALQEDAGGKLWVGTTAGLVSGAGNHFYRVRLPPGVSLLRVLALQATADGGMWIADEKEGLFKAREGRVWPVSLTGVPSQTRSQGIYQLLYDHRDTLWIGLFQGGLEAVHANVVTPYPTRAGVASGPVYSIFSAGDGSLWVGTSGGLSRLRSGRWTTWTRDHGVPNGGVQGIIQDDVGALWLASADGLLRVSLASLAAVADGRPKSLDALHYGLGEGIRMGISRGTANPRLTKSGDGRLWIATEDGVAIIDPKALVAQRTPPPVAIERIFVDGTPLPWNSGSPLSFHGREVQLEYTALGLSMPENIRFSYRLEGLDSNWRDAATRRTAIYTNLAPRSYRFLVRARNDDANWSASVAALPFVVAPYFYQTWWFSGLCLISLAGTAYLLHELRQRTLRARFELVLQERSRLTREVHDTVLQGFAGVLYQLQGASSQFYSAPELARQKLDRALDQADEALREARETLSFMRLSTIENSTLVDALSVAGKKLTEETSIEFCMHVTGEIRKLRHDLQFNLYILAREAIYNAVNHARPQNITLNVAYSANAIRLTVQDDGVGFDPNALPTDTNHFGLSGMRARAGYIGARLAVTSEPGRGTSIEVSVPARWSENTAQSA